MTILNLKLDQPVVLETGERLHYAGCFDNGQNHYAFKNGKTSWTVPPPYNLCDNMKRIDIEKVSVMPEYFIRNL